MSSENETVEEWSIEGLLDEIKKQNEIMQDRSLAFILGAGASISSGIPAGGTLAQGWLKESYRRKCLNQDQESLEVWAAKALDFPDFKLDQVAMHYPKIFELRFSQDQAAGYAALESMMETAEPSLGYSVLAKILDETRHKVVVTTNFDNLVADALSIHALKHPLVVGHEFLAGFIRPRLARPMVAKIHRDLFFHPKNDEDGVGRLEDGWRKALKKLFEYYTPLVIGYGGNDGSLMGFLEDLPEGHIPGRLFWCYRDGARPSESICKIIAKHHGVLIKISDFDVFMVVLARQFFPDFVVNEIQTDLQKLGENRIERYKSLTDELLKKIVESKSLTSQEARLLAEASPDDQDWWTWELRTRAEDDVDQKEKIYLRALEVLPDNPDLLGNYAVFLANERKALDQARTYFKRAFEGAPNSAIWVGNYASSVRIGGDLDQVECLFEKAIQLDPSYAINIGNYACFMCEDRKDYSQAEQLYKRALELDPGFSWAMVNYAAFLSIHRRDFDRADAFYKKALEINANDVYALTNYANFLSVLHKNYGSAEELYIRAIELDATNVNALSNLCAVLLCKSDVDSLGKVPSRVQRLLEVSRGCSQALAEALLYKGLYAERTQGDVLEALGQLKHVLSISYKGGWWNFSNVFESTFPHIDPNRHDFYRALGEAILNADCVDKLNEFELWREVQPIDPFERQ